MIAEAVRLADESGVAAVTMRRLGERLGVEAMSIYHHVRTKAAILDGMVDAVFAEIELPGAGRDLSRDAGLDGGASLDRNAGPDNGVERVHGAGPGPDVGPDGDAGRSEAWVESLRRRCVSARAVLVRHPWAVGLMDSRATPGPATLHHHDRVIGLLRDAGFSVVGAAHAFSLLDSYVYGFVIQEVSLPFDASGAPGAELEDLVTPMLDGAPPTALPHLAELAAHAMTPGYAYGDEFDVGLDVVLAGISARRPTWG
ncbi:TetR family transcriptional regulator [Paraoerskovia sediminicola]|uniref:TetR family transcriptional regulator n=1 Tax=Paraoerskovia sediminicola TaxID=1138587 RepID=A0ABM8G1K0_9CELL|nr:TetR/AcrR family transcriptional regulator C-terminal domain-containing protein [Paraoerskovia sediminicola]BDZ41924.1 TetR family transcriptional regulator [Paraoerskovia sediminicola]